MTQSGKLAIINNKQVVGHSGYMISLVGPFKAILVPKRMPLNCHPELQPELQIDLPSSAVVAMAINVIVNNLRVA